MTDGKSAADKDRKIQMKVFMDHDEHTVITAGANLKKMSVADYMRAAILKQAKEDARELAAIIDTINPGFKK